MLALKSIMFIIFVIQYILLSSKFVYAMINNTPQDIRLRQEAHEGEKRFKFRMLLFNFFDEMYHKCHIEDNVLLFFQPIPTDYSLFLHMYEENEILPVNYINAQELHFHQFYFDSSALRRKSTHQIFADFFIKYSAALATLHFWIESFISSQLEKTKFETKELAHENQWRGTQYNKLSFYTYWLFNLEIDRHMFDLKRTMRKFGFEDHRLTEAFEAYENVQQGLKDLISLNMFRGKEMNELLKYIHKENPFQSPSKRKIFPQKGPWLLIIQYLEELQYNATEFDFNAELFEKIMHISDLNQQLSDGHKHNPSKYAEYLHLYSWLIVDMFMGKDLYALEKFFFTSMVGRNYPPKKFRRPTFAASMKLKQIVGKISKDIWHLNTKKPRRMYGRYGAKIYRSNVIEIVRQIDYIRFGRRFKKNEGYEKEFILKLCKDVILENCSGTFKMVKLGPERKISVSSSVEEENSSSSVESEDA